MRILILVLACLVPTSLAAQLKLRKMPPNVNHTSINNYAPYLSLDGNVIVYISDIAEDNALTMTYSLREGVNWKDPVMMPKTVNNRLNFMKGYGLSADGKTLYISNIKSNGLGGFDIYSSQWLGSSWAEPVNLVLPINSKSNEACPSLSGDGSMMFFMRCEKMDFTKAESCKILMSKKRGNGMWEEPIELPSFINTGNSQTPRIMGDSETLIFSSDKLQPNKGGMDLYVTHFTNGQWSNPQALDFANSTGDDQFVSASSLGRYLMKEVQGTHNSELVEVLFPPGNRPKATTKIDGIVSGLENPSSAFVTVFNMKDQSKVFSTKPGKDGSFVTYIKEGGVYDLSVDPEKDNYTFYSKAFDLTGEKISQVEKVAINLKPAAAGDEIALDGISFKPYSSEVTSTSTQELRRLIRMMQGNPDKSFSILVTLYGLQKDSVRSSPDLSEITIDTLRIPVTHQIDSISAVDSTKITRTITMDSLVIKTTYHNDRTLKQAKVVGDYLIRMGIPSGRLACSGKAEGEAIIENRKTMVKVIVH